MILIIFIVSNFKPIGIIKIIKNIRIFTIKYFKANCKEIKVFLYLLILFLYLLFLVNFFFFFFFDFNIFLFNT